MQNPVLSESRWDAAARDNRAAVMTVGGAVAKTMMLAVALVVMVGVTWNQIFTTNAVFGLSLNTAALMGAFGGLGAAIFAYLVPAIAAPMAFAYALLKGLALGVITFIVSQHHPGLPLMAAVYTLAVLFGMLLLYMTGIIKATPGLVRMVSVGFFALIFGTLTLFLLNMFGLGMGVTDALQGNGPVGIGFSLVCIALGAFSLVVDFGVIETGARNGAPKRFEWQAALGLLVTLVWLYITILRLLMKLRQE